MSKILIVAYWRTGSNLLTSIFTKNGHFDFNEFYSLTGIYSMVEMFKDEHQASNLIEQSNSYLINLLDQTERCSLKINFPHIIAANKQVFDKFDNRILLWRSDFYKMVLSKQVAELRKHWQTTDPTFIQPKFESSINAMVFETSLLSDIKTFEKYIRTWYNSDTIDFVVNYELDLIPYIKQNPSTMISSNNYKILNEHELKEVYLKYQDRIERINTFFENQRTVKNTKNFTDYINTILGKQ